MNILFQKVVSKLTTLRMTKKEGGGGRGIEMYPW